MPIVIEDQAIYTHEQEFQNPRHLRINFESSKRETYKLTIPMLTQHIRIDTIRRHVRLVRQDAAESGGVKTRACADDLGFREAGELLREMSQDVDGVCD